MVLVSQYQYQCWHHRVSTSISSNQKVSVKNHISTFDVWPIQTVGMMLASLLVLQCWHHDITPVLVETRGCQLIASYPNWYVIYRLWLLKPNPKNLWKFVRLKQHLAYPTFTLSLDIQPKGQTSLYSDIQVKHTSPALPSYSTQSASFLNIKQN